MDVVLQTGATTDDIIQIISLANGNIEEFNETNEETIIAFSTALG